MLAFWKEVSMATATICGLGRRNTQASPAPNTYPAMAMVKPATTMVGVISRKMKRLM